jgi:nitroreductase
MSRATDPRRPVHDLIARRWSPRAFADRPVEPEKLRRIFEAARWAPSSSNEQPWSFIVATKDDPEAHARMLACLLEGNQRWAKDAPVLMISVAARAFAVSGRPNPHAWYDVGQATAFMTFEATHLDLYLHQMAGFLPAKARVTFGIPESHDPVAAIAMGYLGDPNALPDDLKQRELNRTARKTIADFVFEGRWGQPARFVQS